MIDREWPPIRAIAYVFSLLLFSSQAGLAQFDLDKSALKPNPTRGSDLAERWCATCHVVSKNQAKGMDGVPSFASVAQRPDLDVNKLAFFLLDPHPVMPNMTLSRNDARDLAAYIATQR